MNACVCANSFPPLRGYLCQQSLRPSDELSSRSGGAGAQCEVGTEKLKPFTGKRFPVRAHPSVCGSGAGRRSDEK